MDRIVAVVVALLSVVAAWLQQQRSRIGSRRVAIKDDLEILRALRRESAAFDALSAHVERSVLDLVRTEDGARRDPSGIAISLVCAMFAVATLPYVVRGGLWLLLLLVTFTFGLTAAVGLAMSVPRSIRDSKGNVIKAGDDAATVSRETEPS